MCVGESDDILDRLQAGFIHLQKGQSGGLIALLTEIETYLQPTSMGHELLFELSIMRDHILHTSKDEPSFESLNRWFFCEWGFNIVHPDSMTGENHFLPTSAFQARQGHPLIAAIFYQHLAKDLGIPCEIINMVDTNIIKTRLKNKVVFIDLLKKGEPLKEEHFLEQINTCGHRRNIDLLSPLDILDGPALLRVFLRRLASLFRATSNKPALIKTLSAKLLLEPANIQKLAERAILWRDVGEPEKALNDLKRYFAFSDKAQAPQEIKLIFYELQAFQMAARPELLH